MTARWHIIEGDSLDVLRGLDPGTVDLVVTDPPYSSGGQYRGDRTKSTGAKYAAQDWNGASGLTDFCGDNRDQRGFLVWCSLLRLARPGAICAMFTDWRQLPMATDALQAGGWVWRGVSAWDKPSARPQPGRPVQACEFIIWGTAGARPTEGTAGPRTFTGVPPRERVHQTEKPVELLRRWCDLAPPGGLVLDPFAGSGATGVAALLTGRRFVGIEISPHFAEVARERLASLDAIGARGTALQPTLWAQPEAD